MTFPSDLEIARRAALEPLDEVAASIVIDPHLLEPHGDRGAKIIDADGEIVGPS